jgi:hypothetical protein
MTLGTRGPWRKMREIGQGAFGKVYLVQRNGEERRFVMKEVNLRGLDRVDVLAAQNEVAVLRKLKVRARAASHRRAARHIASRRTAPHRTAAPPAERAADRRSAPLRARSTRTSSQSRTRWWWTRRCAS